MSQRKDTLAIVAKNMDDLLLRPLCAKHLEPTLPERNGWIKRELLYAMNGRSRKPQIELAKSFGYNEFPQPAGGCSLTDENFCTRLKDLWQHTSIKNYTLDEIILLKIGRHLRITSSLTPIKIIIGRDEQENNLLQSFKNRISLQTCNFPGALILLDHNDENIFIIKDDDLKFISRIAAYFSKGKNSDLVKVQINYPNQSKKIFSVKPLSTAEIEKSWYI